MAWRVDNIPLALKPVFLLWAYTIAIIVRVLFVIHRLILRIEYVYPASLKNNQGPFVYCGWHEDLVLYFLVFIKYDKPFVWMNHPLWFMKPVHILLRWMGVRHIALGSSGHTGKSAMQKVIHFVSKGYNTFINPDGPAGPPRKLKKGVLEISKATGKPVVTVGFRVSRYIQLPTWDKKKLPLPFAKILVCFGEPVYVTAQNMDDAGKTLEYRLNHPCADIENVW